MKIKEVMNNVVTIKKTSNLSEVLKLMEEKKTNFLIVVDQENKFIWWIDIISLTQIIIPDYLQYHKVAAHFVTDNIFKETILEVKEKKITKFIRKSTKVITKDTSTMEAAIIVTEWNQSAIPVLDEDKKPIWMFTRSSLRKLLAIEF